MTPVAFVQFKLDNVDGESTERLVNVAFVAVKFDAKRLVDVVLVPVALVQTIEAVVAFSIMTSPKLPFQRRDGVPRL